MGFDVSVTVETFGYDRLKFLLIDLQSGSKTLEPSSRAHVVRLVDRIEHTVGLELEVFRAGVFRVCWIWCTTPDTVENPWLPISLMVTGEIVIA